MLNHVYGDILTPNKNEDQPVLIFNPVCTEGAMNSKLGRQIQKELPTVFEYYKTKCMLIDAGCGKLGDTQCICILADRGYMFVNGFIFYANNVRAISEQALHNALTDIRIFFRNYTIRVPYMWGDDATSQNAWLRAAGIIVDELVDSGMDVEIWHPEEVEEKKPEYCASIYEAVYGDFVTAIDDDGQCTLGKEADRLLFYDEADAENTLERLNDASELLFLLLNESL